MAERMTSHGEKSVLSENDRATLEQAAQNVMQQFLQDYPVRLPEGIVFPETAARPLVYLLSPLMGEAAKQRGVAKPAMYFFKVLGQYDPMKTINQLESIYGKEAEIAIEEERESNPRHYEFYAPFVKDAKPTHQRYRQRADEIRADLKRRGIDNPSLSIFDDYATEVGSTIRDIRRAFGEKVPAYTLVSDASREQFTQSLAPAHAGLYANELNFPYWEMVGLDYRLDRAAIGVEKEIDPYSMYVATYQGIEAEGFMNPKRNQQRMGQLRGEMRDIGSKIAIKLL